MTFARIEDNRGGAKAATTGAVRAPVNGGLFDQLLYIDTPIANTVSQIRPFYTDGTFCAFQTPTFLKARPSLSLQTLFSGRSTLQPASVLPASLAGKLPVRDGGIVFYPFNSQSNMNRVADRAVHHVLILHGESNKAASFRPAARLYDYVTIAGPLARKRYLQHAIFSSSEIDRGRVIMMGDTFVQTLNWACRGQDGQDGAILYCPTWEGYGGEANNYSSVKESYGFERVAEAARLLSADRIIVKPHPYLGTLKPRMLVHFLSGLRQLRAAGLNVQVALSGTNSVVRAAVRFGFGQRHVLDETCMHETRLALVDTSGMEAVFLKQDIPHVVLTGHVPLAELREIYARKALPVGSDSAGRIRHYLDHQAEIDNAHRALVFGWQAPELAAMSNADRVVWLANYVRANKYWNECSGNA